jgi:hypothetical protein
MVVYKGYGPASRPVHILCFGEGRHCRGGAGLRLDSREEGGMNFFGKFRRFGKKVLKICRWVWYNADHSGWLCAVLRRGLCCVSKSQNDGRKKVLRYAK